MDVDNQSKSPEPVNDAKGEVGSTRPPQHSRAGSNETDRSPSAQRPQEHATQRPPQEGPAEEMEQELMSSDDNPSEEIENFDWEDLESRYHTAMEQCHANEKDLMNEWADLIKFFKIWADAGHTQETNRTFSRLRTRMAHVENSEQRLEKSKQHYIQVVSAFQGALDLLSQRGTG
ncbi:hypothetical protein EJ04DRAFT_519761 [Polyplosphaeria fusca]|uniref:Uncharacterized protein n=1 Tax=Polyplosphaeria fusca TaxID=682080 RepID=A0A9P4R514_9PLEO|nr:hypothetical protein EJ04DRAFT_519761 [Polyplosphaeria fusca]